MKLARQIGSLTAANSIYLICQFGILTALTFYTPVETVGAFGFAMAVFQPGYMLCLLGLRLNLSTDVASRFALSTFISVQALTAAAMVILCLAIIGASQPGVLGIAAPIAAQKYVEAMSNLSYGAMQKANAVEKVARSLLIAGPAAVAVVWGALAATGSAALAFWLQTALWVALLSFHDVAVLRGLGNRVSFDFDARRLWLLARTSAPLGVGHFLAALQVNVPRLIAGEMLGLAAVAMFTIAGYFQRAALTLISSLEHATVVRLSRFHADGQIPAFNRLLKTIVLLNAAFATLICAGIWTLGPWFISVAFGPAYADAAPVLDWIAVAIAATLIGASFQTALVARRRFRAFGWLHAAMLAVIVPAAWVGIAQFGLVGGGMAMAAMAALRAGILMALALAAPAREASS